MVKPAAAAIFAASLSLAASISAYAGRGEATYKTERINWGNDSVSDDRIYARDPVSGKHVVLARQWGSLCRRRAALNYGLGGGCWYPVKVSHRRWRNKQRPGSVLGLKNNTPRHGG